MREKKDLVFANTRINTFWNELVIIASYNWYKIDDEVKGFFRKSTVSLEQY